MIYRYFLTKNEIKSLNDLAARTSYERDQTDGNLYGQIEILNLVIVVYIKFGYTIGESIFGFETKNWGVELYVPSNYSQYSSYGTIKGDRKKFEVDVVLAKMGLSQ